MMPDAIELVIVTPEKQLLREKVVEVQMPGENGYLGVLPGHAPLMTELGIGELSYHDRGGKESAHVAIVRGFAKFFRTASPFLQRPLSGPKRSTCSAPKTHWLAPRSGWPPTILISFSTPPTSRCSAR